MSNRIANVSHLIKDMSNRIKNVGHHTTNVSDAYGGLRPRIANVILIYLMNVTHPSLP